MWLILVMTEVYKEANVLQEDKYGLLHCTGMLLYLV